MFMEVLLAQVPDGTGIIQIFDRYGVSLGMLLLFVLATIYILRRLLHEDKGILTGYVKNTSEQQKQLAGAVETHADTNAKIASVMEGMEERLGELAQTAQRVEHLYSDPANRFSTTALHRAFRHGCDILEEMATKLEIGDKCGPYLDLMKRELDNRNGGHPSEE